MTGMTAMGRLGILVRITTACVLLIGATACRDPAPAVVAATAPELGVIGSDDKIVKLADFNGKVVLVNFWRSECGPCLVEMPEIEAVYQEYRDRGFEVLAINMGQDRQTIDAVRRRVSVTFPMLGDPLKIAAERYRVEVMPTSFIIDGEGLVRERIEGGLTRARLGGKIQALL